MRIAHVDAGLGEAGRGGEGGARALGEGGDGLLEGGVGGGVAEVEKPGSRILLVELFLLGVGVGEEMRGGGRGLYVCMYVCVCVCVCVPLYG